MSDSERRKISGNYQKLSEAALVSLAEEALVQIDELRYDSELTEDGIADIIKFGIAFSGKKVCIKTK